MLEIFKSFSASYYCTIAITIVWVIDHIMQKNKINSLKGDVNDLRRNH